MKNMCELVDVSKSYGEHVVLDKMNMTVREGEMVAITGRSGSGKTTLLNIMGLLEKPDSGAVRLFGENSPRIGSVRAVNLLRTRLSYLFQNCALIDDESVDYNLDIPLIYAKKSRKEKQDLKTVALEKVGLRISLKQKVYQLSGGEQQRVAIARILLKPCDLILADEPTGSLDSDNRAGIMEILKELNNAGKTVIIVTHDQFVADACGRTIKLA
ncbi:MAG TPA: ABC transporter ATP-binding protein [Syntrophaceticus sp.]|jgi:putative ABC transport system ATP-binding protein|uniref:ABC transporter domain-containing protein n=1 Tax=Syntrophaceticus schinkii TaxID=499207 RepID=A0A0B7MFV1_9FIRM|nr:ABC transporter ATP-binding protein [Syntrophaceticus schinkii]CEO88950.1 conserved hypothetical protein [Syntrophaceticus schinkii]HHY30220.1 ABC transporter ATP-binding protein [Syntrophaceticus sp.]